MMLSVPRSEWVTIYWAVVSCPTVSDMIRAEAFGLMLGESNGWWGRKPLINYADNRARAVGRTFCEENSLGRSTLSENDTDQIAFDSLMQLLKSAPVVEKPKSWFDGVLKNKTHEFFKDVHVAAKRPEPETLTGESPAENGADAQPALAVTPQPIALPNPGVPDEDFLKELVPRIEELSPVLRDYAYLELIEGNERWEIEKKLDITSENARQRHSRAHRALQKKLAHVPEVAKRLRKPPPQKHSDKSRRKSSSRRSRKPPSELPTIKD